MVCNKILLMARIFHFGSYQWIYFHHIGLLGGCDIPTYQGTMLVLVYLGYTDTEQMEGKAR